MTEIYNNRNMPIAPEMKKLPGLIGAFNRAGLIGELLKGMIGAETDRDMVVDARKLIRELEKQNPVEIFGLENIPKEGGCLMVFNHPNIDVLLPAILSMIVKLDDKTGQRVCLVQGSEIPMTTNDFNAKTSLPGSVALLRRFHGLYPKNIIPVPTAEDRNDYLTGRAVAVRKIMREFKKNNIVLISPEGHIEENNTISPPETFHKGSGKLGSLATKLGIPTVAMGVWEEDGVTYVNIGKPFFVSSEDPDEAVVEMMYGVALTLPNELRGPFEN